MHNSHNQITIKRFEKIQFKLVVKSKEKIRVKGGDPRHLIGWQN